MERLRTTERSDLLVTQPAVSTDDKKIVLRKLIYSVEELAETLEVSYWIAARMVREGVIYSVKKGGRRGVPWWAIYDYLETPERYRPSAPTA